MNAKILPLSAVALAVLLGLSPAADASSPREAIIIESLVHLDEFSGDFIVSAGAAELGCFAGTFEDRFNNNRSPQSGIVRVLTCTVGGSGTMTMKFQPLTSAPNPGDGGGHWSAHASSGDFAGLHGSGDYSFYSIDQTTSLDTMTGFFQYAP